MKKTDEKKLSKQALLFHLGCIYGFALKHHIKKENPVLKFDIAVNQMIDIIGNDCFDDKDCKPF